MKTRTFHPGAVLLTGLFLLTGTAVAESQLLGFNTTPMESNFSFNNGVKMYAGANVGYASHGSACNLPFFEGSCDDGAMNWKLTGGVRFNPMLGAELSYSQMGETEVSGTYGTGTDPVSSSNRISGYQVTGVGYLPLSAQAVPNPELMGKAGAMFWERETTAKRGDNPAVSTQDDGISPMLGLGAQYQLNQNLHLRTEWDHVFNTGSGSDYETDVDSYSVGMIYSTL